MRTEQNTMSKEESEELLYGLYKEIEPNSTADDFTEWLNEKVYKNK